MVAAGPVEGVADDAVVDGVLKVVSVNGSSLTETECYSFWVRRNARHEDTYE